MGNFLWCNLFAHILYNTNHGLISQLDREKRQTSAIEGLLFHIIEPWPSISKMYLGREAPSVERLQVFNSSDKE